MASISALAADEFAARRACYGVLAQLSVAQLEFDLWATSVLIKRGHRLRIAIAGADKDTFLPYPTEGGVPTITVAWSRVHASRIRLPMKER